MFIQQQHCLAMLCYSNRHKQNMPLKQQSQTPPTVQSAILQTTQDSNTTLHCSLEHLPQGVVIIDAELRLAAWNTRYVELFHFPRN